MCFLEVKIMIVEATIEIRVNSHYDEPQLSVVVIHVSILYLCHHLSVATTVNAPDNQFGSSIPFFTLCQASFFRYLCSHQVYWSDTERTLHEILLSTILSILSHLYCPSLRLPHTQIVFKFLVFIKKQTE